MKPQLPRGSGVAIGYMMFGCIGTIVYWGVWFLVDPSLIATRETAAHYAHENAFPIGDAWMALTGLLGTVALVRRRESALLWMLTCASASIYLGCLDVLYNFNTNLYAESGGAELVIEVVINLATLTGGGYGIAFAWWSRDSFIGWRR